MSDADLNRLERLKIMAARKLQEKLGMADLEDRTLRLEQCLRWAEDRILILESQTNDRASQIEFANKKLVELERTQGDRTELAYLLSRAAARHNQVRCNRAAPIPLQESFARLEARFPKAFPIWRYLFENARIEYEARPETSLSVAGNPGAEAFQKYLAPYLGGRVLDIGCGPQPMPIYLEGSNPELLAGLDPLPGFQERKFEFVQGIAEFIPWPAQEFDTIVIATSLDHVLSLDMAFDEIQRVLKDDGRLVLWMGFVPGAPHYNPDSDDVKAIDAYHMFHFDRPWFEEFMLNRFIKVEDHSFSPISAFFTYKIS